VENRYKSEIEDLTRRYEQMQIEKEALEKRLKEVLFTENLSKPSINLIISRKTIFVRLFNEAWINFVVINLL
jgi:hypothetical protein